MRPSSKPCENHRVTTAERMSCLLANRLPAHSLPREFYTDALFYQLDLEQIWYREWLFVGHDVEVAEPGDYITVTIGDYNLIIIRGVDRRIRALHNVCRHRGSVLCEQASGSVRRRIVCPYHQWSYELDGRLARARMTEPDFDPLGHGLGTAACESVGGMIFASVAETPPDLAPLRALFGDFLAPFDLENAKVAFTSTTIENGNWKLVMENNRECFHCKTAHPELCVSFPEAPLHSGGGSAAELLTLARMTEQCEALGLPSRFRSSPDFQYRAMRMPLRGDARSMTADGNPAVSKRFGALPAVDVGDVLLYHYPSTWNHFMADHAVTFRLQPHDATHTRLVTTWLVPGDAVEGVDYDVDALTSVWRATNAQDVVLVERAQRGVRSPAFRPGPYSLVEEAGVIQFVDWYSDSMRRGLERPLPG